MQAFSALLACPGCGGELAPGYRCCACARTYGSPGGIADLRLDEDPTTKAVRHFYEAAPFPGYPPRETLASLRARAERSDFIRRLDNEIPSDARIVEIGCGTGQTSLFLARASRVVIGADVTRASLELATHAARRFGVDQIQFVQTNLLEPGLRSAAFDVVYCSGVVHHTKNPRDAFSRIARLARPGGIIVLGVYNFYARIPLRLRRLIARATRYRFVPFDPVLRARRDEAERARAWLRDQYQHPEEHTHTLTEVQSWFAENGVDYLRTYPSALLGDDDRPLLTAALDNWKFENWLSQLGWMGALGYEGGLFIIIGRRQGVRTN